MFPTLPRQDPRPAVRRAAIARARATYVIAHAYRGVALRRNGAAVAARVPPQDEFTPTMMAKIIGVDATLLANHAALDMFRLGASPVMNIQSIASPSVTIGDFLGLTRAVGLQHLIFTAPFRASSRIAKSFPPNVEAYREVFQLLPTPPAIEKFSDPSTVDLLFAWERLAGANPLALRGIRRVRESGAEGGVIGLLTEFVEGATRDIERLVTTGSSELAPTDPAFADPPGVLPSRFPVTGEMYRRVMRERYHVDDDIQRAARERRLYLADYKILEGIPQGKWSDGVLDVKRSKYLPAPMALFAWLPATDMAMGSFVPVAIQCEQGVEGLIAPPIFTPLDGVAWQMARSCVQCADRTDQEMAWHLGRTHLVMEAVYLCARNTLAECHPLMVLLAQHCEFTLAINEYATKSLIAPGGQVDVLFGATLVGSLTVMGRALDGYDLSRASPPDEFADRMVDGEGLPEYPYRDDAMILWPAIRRWIDRYVGLYYHNDGDVLGDGELADFLALLRSEEGGDLRGVPSIGTVPALSKFIATLVWIATAQHSSLNYAQYPYFSYAPNSPLALYAPPPKRDTPANELNWEEMLPNASAALAQVDIAYQLSSVTHRALGDYASDAFSDPRVATILKRFREELAPIEARMRDRDRLRFLSYPYLFPSRVQTSVFI